MKRHVRIRCPVCGMLTWQSRLDKKFKFEVKIQEIGSKGQGRITHTYYDPENEEGVWILKLALVEKLEVVLEELKEEIRQDKEANLANLRDEGRYGKVYSVLSTKEAHFGECTSKVTDDGVVVLSVTSPSSPPAVWLLVPKTKSAIVSDIRKQSKMQAEDEVEVIVGLSSSEDGIERFSIPSRAFYYEPVEADSGFEEGDLGVSSELLYLMSGVSVSGVSKAGEVKMSSIIPHGKENLSSELEDGGNDETRCISEVEEG